MDIAPDKLGPAADLIAELYTSKAEAERGEAVPMQPVLDRMQAAIVRIQTKRIKSGQA